MMFYFLIFSVKDKADILLQVDEMTKVKNELSQEVKIFVSCLIVLFVCLCFVVISPVILLYCQYFFLSCQICTHR